MNPFKKIITLSAVALSTVAIVSTAYATEDGMNPDVVPASGPVTVNAKPIDDASAAAAKDSNNPVEVKEESTSMPASESKSPETMASQEVRAEALTVSAPAEPAASDEVKAEIPAASAPVEPAAQAGIDNAAVAG
jgi:hypothetical protein